MNEARLIDIETKLMHMEDTVQSLNNTVYLQQQKLDQLQGICESLVGHLRELSESVREGGVGGGNERPPHY